MDFFWKKASDPFQSNTVTFDCNLKVFIRLKYASAVWSWNWRLFQGEPHLHPNSWDRLPHPRHPAECRISGDRSWIDGYLALVCYSGETSRRETHQDVGVMFALLSVHVAVWGGKNTEGQNMAARHMLTHTLTQVHPNYNCTWATEIQRVHIRFKCSLHTKHPELIATQLPQSSYTQFGAKYKIIWKALNQEV